MLYTVLYLLFLLCLLAFLVGSIIYICTLIYSYVKGAPYVPTDNKELEDIFIHALKHTPHTSGFTMLELGSGDGRVSIFAAQQYKAKPTGIEVNPMLVRLSNANARKAGTPSVTFKTEDINTTEFKGFSLIYIFLLPKLTDSIKTRLWTESDPGTVFISHGFKIKGWEDTLVETRTTRRFNTYYYRK